MKTKRRVVFSNKSKSKTKKQFLYNPNDPNKLLEMNLDAMRRRLDQRIAEERL